MSENVTRLMITSGGWCHRIWPGWVIRQAWYTYILTWCNRAPKGWYNV